MGTSAEAHTARDTHSALSDRYFPSSAPSSANIPERQGALDQCYSGHGLFAAPVRQPVTPLLAPS
jgi:hypothetical protein